jgi:DNA-binding NarL/FixJ family response regulator
VADEISVLIVDDHEVVREGLRLSLSRAPHIRVVGEAADGVPASRPCGWPVVESHS